MLAYAMIVLFAVAFACVPYYLYLYVRRGDKRYLYLLALGWSYMACAHLLFLAGSHYGRLFEAMFGALHLAGAVLLVGGAFAYFVRVPATRLALWTTGGAVALFALYWLFPQTGGLTMIGENAVLGSTALYGVVGSRHLRKVSSFSYYWLMATLVVGLLAAVNWLRLIGTPVGGPVPVTPWLGTTIVLLMLAFFLVHVENAIAVNDLERSQAELREYRGDLEVIVQQRTAELVEANEAKSQFLRAMSHELRTPLNSIIGFSGTLAQEHAGPLNTEQHRQVEMIRASGELLLDLVNRLLDMSRIESGSMDLCLEEFEVAESVAAVAESVRPLAQSKGLALDVFIGAECGVMRSDRVRVEQILLNLLGNAVKFTETGHVSIAVGCAEGDEVEFVARDTGHGIATEHVERIFDEYYQVPSRRFGKVAGAGLGLPVSRNVARMLGGDITVESVPGVGSAFTLRLPRQPGCGEAEAPASEA